MTALLRGVRSCVFPLLCAVALLGPVLSAARVKPGAIDVLHYDVEVKPDFDQRTISFSVGVPSTNAPDASTGRPARSAWAEECDGTASGSRWGWQADRAAATGRRSAIRTWSTGWRHRTGLSWRYARDHSDRECLLWHYPVGSKQ